MDVLLRLRKHSDRISRVTTKINHRTNNTVTEYYVRVGIIGVIVGTHITGDRPLKIYYYLPNSRKAVFFVSGATMNEQSFISPISSLLSVMAVNYYYSNPLRRRYYSRKRRGS